MTTTKAQAPTTACGCCGSATIPPTPGTNEAGHYCETCGTAWDNPAAPEPGSCMLHREVTR